ncbi:MAG: lysylphosphatidylglycerol synthase transmembrane domain-containing protein [Candidatus Acidiferrum sp.]
MIGAHQAEKRSRGWRVIVLRWVAAVVVLGILLHFLPLHLLGEAIQRVRWTRFLAILLGYLLAHAVGIAKWRMVVNAAGARLDYVTCAQCYTGGLFATLFLPSIIGGDVVRLAVGLRQSPNPAAVLAGNVLDRFLDLSAQAGLVLLGVLLLPGSLPMRSKFEVRKAIFVIAVIFLALVALTLLLHRPILRGRSVRFRRRLARLRYALRAGWRRPHLLAFGWMLGTVIQCTFLVLTALLAISCGLFLPLRVWFFAWPLAKLAALLPLTQGGIGVREAALVGLLSPFGAPAHLVLAAGLVWEGVVIAGGLIAGCTAFVLRRGEELPRKS